MDPTTQGNSSNGLDLNGLMSNLLNNATDAYVANQQSQSSQALGAAAIAAAAAQPANPLVAVFGSNQNFILIGVGVLALALILRR